MSLTWPDQGYFLAVNDTISRKSANSFRMIRTPAIFISLVFSVAAIGSPVAAMATSTSSPSMQSDNIVMLGDTELPEYMSANGTPILSSPAKLQLHVEDRVIDLDDMTTVSELADGNKNSNVSKRTYRVGDLSVDVDTHIDTIGLVRTALSLSSTIPVTLDYAELILPLNTSIAHYYSRYLDYSPRIGRFVRKNILGSYGEINQLLEFAYTPAFWAGNEVAGIEVILESDKHLHAAGSSMITLTPTEDSVVLRMRIAGAIALSSTPIFIEFGILPTPVHTPRNNHDTLVFGDWNLPPGNLEGTRKFGILMLGNFPRRFPTHPSLDFTPVLTNAQGEEPHTLLHDRILSKGIRPIPYGALNAASVRLPGDAWSRYGERWRTGTDQKRDTTRHYFWQRAMGLDANMPSAYLTDLSSSSFRNYLLDETLTAIRDDGIRGVYYDYAMPFTVSRNVGNAHASAIAQGAQHFPLFDQYNFLANLHTRATDIDSEFRIICHASKLPVILSAYCDDVVAGEPLNVVFSLKPRTLANRDPDAYVPDYLSLPDAYWIAEHGSGAYPSMLLSQVSKWNSNFIARSENDALYRRYSRNFLAQALAWNVRIFYARLHRGELEKYTGMLAEWHWFRDSLHASPVQTSNFVTWRSKVIESPDSPLPRLALHADNAERRILIIITNNRPLQYVGSFDIDLAGLVETLGIGKSVVDGSVSGLADGWPLRLANLPVSVNANDSLYFEFSW